MSADKKLRAAKRTSGGRERLLEAATSLFNEHGLAGTSLQMIAERLGVSKPALYHHFRSRDDIVVSLMKPVIDDADRAVAAFEQLSVRERPAAARMFYADFLVKHRRIVNMVFFDRGALSSTTAHTVDELVDKVALALSDEVNAESIAVNVAKVYGAAALVTRSAKLGDSELVHLIGRVLEPQLGLPALE